MLFKKLPLFSPPIRPNATQLSGKSTIWKRQWAFNLKQLIVISTWITRQVSTWCRFSQPLMQSFCTAGAWRWCSLFCLERAGRKRARRAHVELLSLQMCAAARWAPRWGCGTWTPCLRGMGKGWLGFCEWLLISGQEMNLLHSVLTYLCLSLLFNVYCWTDCFLLKVNLLPPPFLRGQMWSVSPASRFVLSHLRSVGAGRSTGVLWWQGWARPCCNSCSGFVARNVTLVLHSRGVSHRGDVQRGYWGLGSRKRGCGWQPGCRPERPAVPSCRPSEAPGGRSHFAFFPSLFHSSPTPRVLPSDGAAPSGRRGAPPHRRGQEVVGAASRRAAASLRRSGCWGAEWPPSPSAGPAPPSPPWAGSPGEGSGGAAAVTDGPTRSGTRGCFE